MRILWHIGKRVSNKNLIRFRDALRRAFGKSGSGRYICNVGGLYGYPKEIFESNWFEYSATLQFEGHAMNAPAEWDLLLKNMFGDYMKLPPLEERKGHI